MQFVSQWIKYWTRTITSYRPSAHTVALLVVLLIALVLRVIWLADVPPGVNQDESPNAFNAWCLLHAGKDYAGQPWPIFYTEALGANRSTLYMYLILPFQAVGGFNIWTMRLPAVILGVLAIGLVWYIGKRLFNPWVGLVAAMVLAVNPWHLLMSRWGHEASIGATLVLLPIAAMLWANLPPISQRRKKKPLPEAKNTDGAGGDGTLIHKADPPVDDGPCDTPATAPATEPPTPDRRPDPWRAMEAGAIFGLCCYGYPSVRIVLGVLLPAMVVVTCFKWLGMLLTKRGLAALAMFTLAVAATFGPLVYVHLTDEAIGKRFKQTHVWDEDDSFDTKVQLVANRYLPHFGRDWLLDVGDHLNSKSPFEMGNFHSYAVVLMIIGAVIVLPWAVASARARVLVIFVLLYPVGDLLTRHFGADGMHSLRSFPAMGALVLLAGVGGGMIASWLARWRTWFGWLPVVALACWMTIASWAYLPRYYNQWGLQHDVQRNFHVDLFEASQWLAPRLDEYDAVFVTNSGMNRPYITVAMGLRIDPHDWFTQGIDKDGASWVNYLRHGKVHYLKRRWSRYRRDLLRNGKPDRVLLIVRPWRWRNVEPIAEFHQSDGEVTLVAREVTW